MKHGNLLQACQVHSGEKQPSHRGTPLPPVPPSEFFGAQSRARLTFCREFFDDFCFRGLPRFHFTGKFS
jgi:hypothetical protein